MITYDEMKEGAAQRITELSDDPIQKAKQITYLQEEVNEIHNTVFRAIEDIDNENNS